MDFQKELNALNEYYEHRFLYIGRGRNRIAYSISKNYIIKIPINQNGIDDNWYEATCFRKGNKNYPYARCRMFGDFILVMEKLNLNVIALPEWAKYIDCAQIGYDLRGKLKVYDYGIF